METRLTYNSITGGVFDWILPVQRGSENQTNAFECYANLPGFPAQPEFRSSKSADTRSAENWANAEIFANDCFTAMNLTGEFIGSAFDARDWMSVVDALGEDGLLRYYGVSAGTTLGNHLVSMFPDRIDKVILDGIVNPLEYVRNKEVEIFTDVDKLFTAFCEACVATPENCTLGMNKTAAELEGTIKAAVDGLLEDPIVIQLPGVSGGFLLDYTTVKGAVYSTLYFPWQWTGLAAQFQAILDRDIETLAAAFGGPQATVFVPSSRNEAMYGIKCADSDKYAELADWEVIQDARHEQSYWGDASDIVVSCARWRFDAKERYTGNFTVQTRNPVMLIGNTADPVTPIASARNASAGYEGSVVLQHDSYGVSTVQFLAVQFLAGSPLILTSIPQHCSHLTQPSLCTGRAIREYFLNGVLPEPGTVCPVDIPLFLSAEEWTLGWLAVGLELGPA